MRIPVFQVDAFTATAFAGNPAAVCLLPAAREAEWMQRVAQEMNLSETAFLFVSRFFAPRVGINEDPVTGSAHCRLGPYWCTRLKKEVFLAYQASARGGVLRVRVQSPRVYLGGQAVTVLRGELL